MKHTLIKFLLLFVLSFNIAHASIIAVLDDCDDCHHNSLYESLTISNTKVVDSSDLCSMHHCFHFVGIIQVLTLAFDNTHYSNILSIKITAYSPPSKERSNKPPIS